jgi:hypothetical protein
MTDETNAPASAGAEEESVSKIWAELDALDRGEPLPDDGQSAATGSTAETAEEPQDQQAAADAQAADTAQEGQQPDAEQGNQSTGEDGGTSAPTEPVDEKIAELEHKVSSAEGRIPAYERDGRRRKAAQVRERVNGWQTELAALKKRRTELTAKTNEGNEQFREDYPDIAQSLEADRKSQDDALAARETALTGEISEHVREQSEIMDELHPDFADVLQKHGQDVANFVKSGGLSVQAMQGFQENIRGLQNAHSAALFMNEFKAHMTSKGVVFPTQTEIPNGKPADPQSDQSAVASAPSDAVAQQTQVTQPDPDAKRRQKQLEGATSTTGNTHPPMSSKPPEDASTSEHWAYFEALDREKAKKARAGR